MDVITSEFQRSIVRVYGFLIYEFRTADFHISEIPNSNSRTFIFDFRFSISQPPKLNAQISGFGTLYFQNPSIGTSDVWIVVCGNRIFGSQSSGF